MPKLTIDIEARLASFQDSLDRLGRDAQGMARRLEGAFGGLRRALGGLVAGAGIAGIAASFKSVADAADEMGKAAQKTGTTAEALSALKYAADLAGVSFEGLQTGLRKLSTNMVDTQTGTGEAADAFKALGISVEASKGVLKSNEQVLTEIAERFAKMQDSAGKTALAVKLFGRAGAELVPLLNAGAEGLAAARQEAERLGIIIDSSTAKAAERFNDNLTRLARTIEGFKLRALGPLLQTLADVTDAFTRAATSALSFGEKLKLLFSGDVNLGRFQELVAQEQALQQELENVGSRGVVQRLLEGPDAGRAQAIKQQIDFVREQKATLERLMEARGRLAQEVAAPAPGRLAAPAIVDSKRTKSEADSAARALLSLQEARSKALLAEEQATAKARLEVLERYHADGLVAEEDYWRTRLEIQRAASEASIRAVEEEIAARQDALAKAPKGSAEFFRATQALEEAMRRRNEVEREFGRDTLFNYLDAQQAAQDYRDEVTKLSAEFLTLQGRTREALELSIDLEQRSLRRRAGQRGDTAAIISLDAVRQGKIAQAAFNQERERGNEILADLAIAEERIQNARRVGATTELESLAQTSEARQQAAGELQTIAERLRSIAAQSGLPELSRQAKEFAAEVEGLAANANLLAEKFDSIGESALGTLFDDLVSGSKSAKEAIADFASSVVSEINKLIAQELGRKLYQSILGGGGGLGDLLGGLFTGSGLGALAGGGGGPTPLQLSGPFQHGGSFLVGGAGGIDSQLVAFRASPGERVDVRPPGKGLAQAITINVSVPPGTNRGSASQIATEVALATQRALRRNG